MKHWTVSDIKGGKEFGIIPLWNEWNLAARKIKYNESNWINDSNPLYTNSKTKNLFSAIPFMSTTNKIAAILVNVSDSATTPLTQIRLKVYDPDTLAELGYSHTNGISTTSKQITKVFNNMTRKYLSYTYSIVTFTPSTT